MTYHLDEIDRKILSALFNDARKAYLEIARDCGVSGAAIHQRIKKLYDSGVLQGTRTIVNPLQMGYTVCAFITVELSESNKFRSVIEAVQDIPEVVECHFITGKATLLLKVFCTDNKNLLDLLINKIQQIPNVTGTDTMISLDQSFDRQIVLPEV